ncbi:MAG: site-specific DNA-methyltransferase [Candidatus Eisenbacteria bacterium]|nr:site-specific DNA-methyltransferase [Candidatus Eisenbacteria bacterium]
MTTLAAPRPAPAKRRTRLYALHHADAFEWLRAAPEHSIHAVVTDPPYGLLEYSAAEVRKLRNGRGGVWRIPPSFDGHLRRPLPRFTVLDRDDHENLRRFFRRLAGELERVLVPGAHVIIATHPLLSHLVYQPMLEGGFEKRGEIVRLVQTLRGGDRPKNAHEEFAHVSVMPRSQWEPWGLFRKPCDGRVQDNLRRWGTGGLRRISAAEPFGDVIVGPPATRRERAIAPHPSLKPQAFLRRVVRASLPMGKGTILDPFMGSGSTIAAATAMGLASVGIESDRAWFRMAAGAVPRLAALTVDPPDAHASGR